MKREMEYVSWKGVLFVDCATERGDTKLVKCERVIINLFSKVALKIFKLYQTSNSAAINNEGITLHEYHRCATGVMRAVM